jgi:hypothetical protein
VASEDFGISTETDADELGGAASGKEEQDKDESERMRRLVAKLKKDEDSRSSWRDKQAAWARMRSVGIGRVSLPFRGASDFHFPLADTFIEKLKPFYYQQALQPDPLCSFVPKKQAARALSTLAAHWFDYQVRTKSNFRSALPLLIDLLLERGIGLMKVLWDYDNECLCFEAVDPVNFIIPPSTDSLQGAVRCCQVLYLNKSDYLRQAKESGWETNEQWIKSCIAPRPDTPEVDQDKQWISGVQFDEDDELMILWEVYSKDKEGNLIIDLLNPNKPDEPARPAIKDYPYNHKEIPYIPFHYERKSRGWYENRGITEIVSQFEMELCKLENEKLDYMTYVNRPIFTHKGATINPGNIKLAPGQLIGNELSVVQFQPPPMDFDVASKDIREIAQDRIGMPDFGLGRSNDFSQPRTAKEAQMLQQYNNQGVDLRGRVFDEGLHDLYCQAWSLLLQENKHDLEYTYRHEYNEIDESALADIYILTPNGNPDGYDKNQEISRLVNLAQVPMVGKFIDPEKFARVILELADTRYLRELFIGGQGNIRQAEQQMAEIGDMLNGFEIHVQADDDPGVHIKVLLTYFDFAEQAKIQVPILPSFNLYKHFLETYQQYSQMDPEGFKQDKQILDQAKGKVEQAIPLIQQALKDGIPPMASLNQIMQHMQEIRQQMQQQNSPLGPAQAPPGGPPAQGSPQYAQQGPVAPTGPPGATQGPPPQ